MQLYTTATIISLMFVHFAKVYSQAVPVSPCPRKFQYRFDGSEWFGLLSVRNTDFNEPLNLQVTLSMRGKPATNFLGDIELLTRGQHPADTPIFYKIKFPKSHYPPKLLKITKNNHIVCFGATDQSIFVTQIQLEHTRKFTFPTPTSSFLSGTAGMEMDGMKELSMLSTNTALHTKHLPFASIEKHDVKHSKESCGTIDDLIRFQVLTALNQNEDSSARFKNSNDNLDEAAAEKNGAGESLPIIASDTDFGDGDDGSGSGKQLYTITRGAWPWLAAAYVNNLTSLVYQCGGTLVSSRVVISSAHCFHLFNQRYTANEVLVFLGRHNLANWNEEGTLAAPVDNIYIHPDFNQNLNSFDADIAVVILKNEVRFNAFIRPACLWSGATNKEYIEGEHGVVVGWNIGSVKTGKQSSTSSTVPKILSAPIVSNEACFQANPLYQSISSNRTFCAGVIAPDQLIMATKKLKKAKQLNFDHQMQQGLCTGDSGAGLMILKSNRWLLRGTVSGVLPLPATDSTSKQRCSINQYVVYVDVAEFLDWIFAFII